MEIPQTWLVQNFVAQKNIGVEFSTVDVAQVVGKAPKEHITNLDKMKCLDKTHQGTRGNYYTRDPNRYVKNSLPGAICLKCPMVNSGTTGCILQRPQMLAQLGISL